MSIAAVNPQAASATGELSLRRFLDALELSGHLANLNQFNPIELLVETSLFPLYNVSLEWEHTSTLIFTPRALGSFARGEVSANHTH